MNTSEFMQSLHLGGEVSGALNWINVCDVRYVNVTLEQMKAMSEFFGTSAIEIEADTQFTPSGCGCCGGKDIPVLTIRISQITKNLP